MTAVLAVDQGTSGTKAVVLDADGTVRAVAEVPVAVHHRAGGAVEEDPHELLDSVLTAGRNALAASDIDVDVVALANQGETVLAWDRGTGAPQSPAIVWQDRRAQSVVDALGPLPHLAARTGLVADPYFSAPKLAWLRERAPATAALTTSDTWLVHQLCGAYVTDASTASRSLLLALGDTDWADDLAALFGLDPAALPRIVACDDVVGTTRVFGPELPVAGLMVDQQAALLGERCLEPGSVKCTFGTGAFLLANTGFDAPRSDAGLTTSVAWRLRGATAHCLDGQVYAASSALRWLHDLGVLADVRDIDAVAADDAGSVVCVPALTGLGAPWWRPDARGVLTGMSLGSGRGEVVRAVLEGIAAQVAAVADAAAADLGTPLCRLRVDGGLTRSAALMQAVADVTQRPVDVYPGEHATAAGVGAAGRLAVDPTLTIADAVAPWTPTRTHEPRWSHDRAADFRTRWDAAMEHS